jgi:uncharacterized membrane protein YozB (DUF420 family)
MVSPFEAQTNLVFQIVILVLLFVSLILKKRRSYFLHGSTMMIAAILNAVSFMLVMGPSILNLGQLVVDKPLDIISVATMAHGVLGAVAEFLAVWVVVSWRLRSSTTYCAGRRRAMRVTLVLWLIALFLGIWLYALLYII